MKPQKAKLISKLSLYILSKSDLIFIEYPLIIRYNASNVHTIIESAAQVDKRRNCYIAPVFLLFIIIIALVFPHL